MLLSRESISHSTAAATEPPPRNYHLKYRVVGGSYSSHRSAIVAVQRPLHSQRFNSIMRFLGFWNPSDEFHEYRVQLADVYL